MDDLQWPRTLNKVVTKRWSQLKNTLVIKDFVDHLIQKRVVTLEYWMSLKSKPIPESERMEDFLALVMKFNQQKYLYFLEALHKIDRGDLVKDLSKAIDMKPQKEKDADYVKTVNKSMQKDSKPKAEKAHKVGSANSKPKRTNLSNTKNEMLTTTEEKEKVRNIKGQTDADQMPTNNGSVADGNVRNSSNTGNSNSNPHKTTPVAVPKQQKQMEGNQSTTTENLHKGIGNAEKKDQLDIKDKNENPVQKTQQKLKKTVEFKDENKNVNTLKEELATGTRPGSSKTKEEILEEREKELLSKESELKKKEMELQEHERSLIEKETHLLTRENSLLTNHSSGIDDGLQALPSDLSHLQFGSNKTTASTTTSSEILAEVREQLKEMKRIKEIESEHVSSCNTPKEEFVRVQDFQNVQQNIDDLTEEIKTERSSRENVQQKMEDLKHEIETLQTTIKQFEDEKEIKDVEIDREINRLKTELKNAKSNYNEGINRLKRDSSTKESEIKSLQVKMESMKTSTEDLEKRVKMLENDKARYEHELQRYEKEVSELRKELENKENELADLRKVLADTESEKEDLIDEIAELKNEINKLKGDKKKLEAEKKTLLGRCVKPQWNQSPSGSLRRTSFK
ncbi:hypothetical protein ACF0H5_014790 [Mactra antiquata]